MSGSQLATAAELQQLRDWLSKIPYIDLSLCDDNFLQHYYVHRRGSLQETKEAIHNFFKSFHLIPKELTQLDPARPEVYELYKGMYDFVGPKLTDQNELITYHSLLPMPLTYNITRENILKDRRRVLCKILKFPPSVNGCQVILDFENYSLEVTSHFDLALFQQFYAATLKSVSIRFAKIHALNVGPLTRIGYMIASKGIDAKYANRMIIHPDLESLYKHIPKSHLPSDLGGELGTRAELTAEYHKMELNYRDQLLKWQESLGGMHGKFDNVIGKVDTSTFRKLEVD